MKFTRHGFNSLDCELILVYILLSFPILIFQWLASYLTSWESFHFSFSPEFPHHLLLNLRHRFKVGKLFFENILFKLCDLVLEIKYLNCYMILFVEQYFLQYHLIGHLHYYLFAIHFPFSLGNLAFLSASFCEFPFHARLAQYSFSLATSTPNYFEEIFQAVNKNLFVKNQ